ncbi:MAG: hypothetical protein E7511_03415 [Ruminococcus sp.]|nr:hypothetical protein [Ruminococcus sp.]
MKVKHQFPVVLLCITMVLVLVVTGFALPLFLPKEEQGKSDQLSDKQLLKLSNSVQTDENGFVLPAGKSDAFTVTPVDGITISAEANALDKNRKFKMEEVSPEVWESLETSANEHIGPQMVVGAWELDAGLADDEVLPGSFQMQYDLKQLGIPEELYDRVHAYRVDDSGVFYEYAGGLEGDTLTISSRQNSISLLSIAIGSLLVTSAVKVLDKAVTGAFQIDYIHGSVKVPLDGMVRYEILMDLSFILKTIGEDGITRAENDARTRAKENILEKINLRYDKDYSSPAQIEDPALKEDYRRWVEKEYNRLLKEDDAYQRQRKQIEDAALMSKDELREQLEQIRKVKEYCEDAYSYLKDVHKLKMPDYTIMVHLSPNAAEGGVAFDPYLGNPYMVLMMQNMFSSGRQEDYEKLLLTIVHENFHICQREYLSDLRSTYKVDESTAQTVEYEAMLHFYPTKISSLDHASNMYRRDQFVYGLNKYKMKYPEGTVSTGDKAAASYPMANFWLYLRETDDTGFGVIMSRYSSLTFPSLTTTLKSAYGLTEEQLTDKFLSFAEDKQTDFYEYALRTTSYDFMPCQDFSEKDVARIKLYNNDYTLRMRKLFIPAKDESDQEYCLLLRVNDDYADIMNDYRIIPVNMQKGADYREWTHGLFFEPHSYRPGNEDDPYQWFIEADGGTGGYWNTTSGYALYVMRTPAMPISKVRNDNLQLVLPDLPVTGTAGGWFSSGEPELIDSYVLTFRIGDRQILQKQVTRTELDALKRKDKPYEMPIAELYQDGKPLTEEQKYALTLTIRECAADTYETDKCFGPESPACKVWDDIDITGEWDVTSKIGRYEMGWADKLIGMMPDEMQEFKDGYNSVMESLVGTEGHSVMTVEAQQNSTTNYDVKFIPEEEDGVTVNYLGVWNADERTLTLKPQMENDVAGSIVLNVAKSEAGEVFFESEIDVDIAIVSVQAVMNGKKRLPDTAPQPEPQPAS